MHPGSTPGATASLPDKLNDHAIPDKPDPTAGNSGSSFAELPHDFFEPQGKEIPKPNDDPYSYFLKPMLEKDAMQCNAWKEEVQNILIFAGLFSAVVTAFIVESYKSLQPDPNDSIILLLSHIAGAIDKGPLNETMVQPLFAIPDSHTSSSSINVNIFWFISLVLSLTVALIGIITLQWLREHQRYDNTLTPRETFALYNLRVDSIEQWGVPKIFAALPLLLQGALILFFAGIVEFLFALNMVVAVTVTAFICIPTAFLTGTTLLPTLQLYILKDPFGLAVNNEIPRPCPYKSPQAHAFLRLGTTYKRVFNSLSFLAAGSYKYGTTFTCFIRQLSGGQMPLFRSRPAHFKDWLDGYLSHQIDELRRTSGDWGSLDRSWLSVRTGYAALLHQNGADIVKSNLFQLKISPDVYDCAQGFHKIMRRDCTDADDNALYHCMQTLCVEQIRSWEFAIGLSQAFPNMASALKNLCAAFGGVLLHEQWFPQYYSPLPEAFIEDVLQEPQDVAVEILRAATTQICLSSMPYYFPGKLKTIARLEIRPERIFRMSSGDTWLPRWMVPLLHSSRPDCAERITSVFRHFVEEASTIVPDASMNLRPAPVQKSYGALASYITVIVQNQNPETIAETLDLLEDMCHPSNNPMEERPYLLVLTCFYLDAITLSSYCTDVDLNSLLSLVLSLCSITKDKLSYEDGWEGLDDAIDSIYRYHSTVSPLPHGQLANSL